MKFKIDILIDLVPRAKGLLIPVFKIEGSNMPFVQEMNDSFEVHDMQPYLAADNYEYEVPIDGASTDIGEKGVAAFRSFDDQIFIGDITAIMEYRDFHRDKFVGFPLLDLQLARLCGEPLSAVYSKWSSVGDTYFGASKGSSWSSGEHALYQKNGTIWENINRTNKDERNSVFDQIKDHSFEYIFRWLVKNNLSAFWPKIWIHAFKLNPFDERLQVLAEQWLQSQMGQSAFLSDIKLVLFCYMEYAFRNFSESVDFKEAFTEYIINSYEDIYELLHPILLPYLSIRNIEYSIGGEKARSIYNYLENRISGDSRYDTILRQMRSYLSELEK